MEHEYLHGAKDQLSTILGSVAEFEDQLKRTLQPNVASRSTVRSIQPGLSGAAVFLVSRLANGAPMVPLVAKVSSDVNLVTTERDNYEKYIRSKLVNAPSLLPTGSSKILFYEYGGFLADFKPQTLRSGYANSTPDALAILMQRIVTALSPLHHLASDSTSCVDRINLQPPLDIRLDAVAKMIPQNTRDAILSLLDSVRKKSNQYPSKCMTGHGDLNSGNILFEPGAHDSYPLFIDFASIERSKDNTAYPIGYHFPFWDYAKLERDIKTRLFLNEAIAEGLEIPDIVNAIRLLDSEQVRPSAFTSASVGKLFKVVDALRESVRKEYAPAIYSSGYGLAVAYATLSVLYRSQPDNDLPLDVQTLVAAESAMSLLSRAPGTLVSMPFAGTPSTSRSGKSSTTVVHSDAIQTELAEKAEMLLLRLYKTCLIAPAKNEDLHLWVPGYGVDMQWGTENEEDRLAWLFIVEDLYARGLLEMTEREREYKLSDAGLREAWRLVKVKAQNSGSTPVGLPLGRYLVDPLFLGLTIGQFLVEYVAGKALEKTFEAGAVVFKGGKFINYVSRLGWSSEKKQAGALVARRENACSLRFRDYHSERLLAADKIKIAYAQCLCFVPGFKDYADPTQLTATVAHPFDIDASLGIPGYKKVAVRYREGLKHSVPYGGSTVRIADWDGSRSFSIARADYLDQFVSNQIEIVDVDLCDIVQDSDVNVPPELAHRTLREIDTADNRLAPFSKSRLANTVGIAGTLVTSDGYLVLPKRNKKVHFASGYEGSSISGVLEWSEGLRVDFVGELTNQLIGKEGAHELLTKGGLCTTVPLAFARELERAGKPQFFFHVWADETLASFIPRWEQSIYPREEYDSIRWVKLFDPTLLGQDSNAEAQRSADILLSLLSAQSEISLDDGGYIALSEEARANIYYLLGLVASQKAETFPVSWTGRS